MLRQHATSVRTSSSKNVSCDDSCARFLESVRAASGLRTSKWVLEPPLAQSVYAFVSCNGVSLGGAQLRCLETARMMSARGMASTCIKDCTSSTMRALAARKPRAIVFLKTLPHDFNLLFLVRAATPTLLLDTMDLSPTYHAASCKHPQAIHRLDGVIVNNRASWARIKYDCPRLAAKRVHYIEHFHSVPRRLSNGSRWRVSPRALLLMEHRVLPSAKPWCKGLKDAMSPTMRFDCRPLWGGPNARRSRENFFKFSLGLSTTAVQWITSRHLGAGEMFNAVYQKYDVLLQWWPTTGSAQRLLNALATGIPVIAIDCPAFAEAVAGHPDVLLVRNLSEVAAATTALARSPAFRARVSNAGLAVADRFSPDSIAYKYRRAFNASDHDTSAQARS